MSINNSCEKTCSNVQSNASTKTGNGFIILIVLYILLAIILGSRLY